jgi:hypothetical protein
MRLLGLIAFALSLSGCVSLPTAVEPMPTSEAAFDGEARLCDLLLTHELADDNCTPVFADGSDFEEVGLLTNRRNELTHRLMEISTGLCTDFKNRLSGRTTSRIAGLDAVATWLAAGASAVTGPGLARGLAGGAAASYATSGILEDRYVGDIDSALNGIEIERTRIAKQILDKHGRTVQEYPVARAVNDVMRYHAVCNVVDGRNAAQEAMGDAVSRAATGSP